MCLQVLPFFARKVYSLNLSPRSFVFALVIFPETAWQIYLELL
jgi:hypothetical protein